MSSSFSVWTHFQVFSEVTKRTPRIDFLGIGLLFQSPTTILDYFGRKTSIPSLKTLGPKFQLSKSKTSRKTFQMKDSVCNLVVYLGLPSIVCTGTQVFIYETNHTKSNGFHFGHWKGLLIIPKFPKFEGIFGNSPLNTSWQIHPCTALHSQPSLSQLNLMGGTRLPATTTDQKRRYVLKFWKGKTKS